MKALPAKKGFEWIKSNKSGTICLFPAGSIRDNSGASDEDLKVVGMDEPALPTTTERNC